MCASILQRMTARSAHRSGEPLQSPADHNTRKADSGILSIQPLAHKLKRCVAATERFFDAGRRRTNQEIWPQLEPDCPIAVWSASCRRGPRAIYRRLPEGDIS
jgi:hypothetical protein